MVKSKNTLDAETKQQLLQNLQKRFEKNSKRHPGIDWQEVAAALQKNASKLWSLQQMEESGGEPDVITNLKTGNGFCFVDCSAETPSGRRSLCYDREGLESRKEHRPANSAIDMSEEMGIRLLTEEEYRHLQTLGKFDQKTSSWVHTPGDIRDLGGSIFGDYRYGRVFIYHNGAQSYYASRGFRGILEV